MANTIKIKNSGIASATPNSLEYGELGLNYADGKIYYKNSLDTIVALIGPTGPTGPTGAKGSYTVSATTPLSPSANDVWFNSDDGRTYIYYNDGNTSQWVEFGNANIGPTSSGSISEFLLIGA